MRRRRKRLLKRSLLNPKSPKKLKLKLTNLPRRKKSPPTKKNQQRRKKSKNPLDPNLSALALSTFSITNPPPRPWRQ